MDAELRKVIGTALPLVLVELASSLYSLTDTYFVGGLGEAALAALGISMYILMLLQTFLALFVMPTMIMASQGIGANRREEVRRSLGEMLFIGAVYSIALGAMWYALSISLVVLQSGASGEVLHQGVSYLRWRLIGYPILYIAMTLDMVIVATGHTKYSLIANVIGLLSNVILDPLLIYGYLGFPALGIAGAAIATVVSNTFTIPAQLLFLRGLGILPSVPREFSAWRRALRLGAPVFAERLIFSLGNNAYAGVIARLGTEVMAAHQIGLRIESLIYMPGFAFSISASALVGQLVGANELRRAKEVGLRTILLGAGLMGALGLVVALGGRYFVIPFTNNAKVRELASIYLILAGLSEAGLGLAMVTGGALRGAGNTKVPMIVNVISLIALRVFPSPLLALSLGPIGPWLAMFVDVYVRGLALFLLYNKKFYQLVQRIV